MSASTIRVTIDRLVLQGFPAGQRDALAKGLERELGRVLAAGGGAPTASASLARLSAPSFAPGPTAGATGEAAARAIGGALKR